MNINTASTKDTVAVDRVALARAALSDSSLILDHLRATFSTCIERLRAGDAAPGMSGLARGLSDLDQFVQLIEAISEVARHESSKNQGLKHDLWKCMEELEPVLVDQDFTALANGLEGRLLPLFPGWEETVGELNQMIQ